MIFNVYKQKGETPLECIQRFIKENPSLKKEKMTYLGRLDPLAEGVLLVGSGEDTTQSRREEFFGLDKEYDFVSLFGFTTDTYDILGKIIKVKKIKNLSENEVRKVAMIYKGKRKQKYPPYSSKVISNNNKKAVPLRLSKEKGEKRTLGASQDSLRFFEEKSNEWTDPVRRGGEVKKIIIYKIQFHKLDSLNTKELFGRLLMDISKVKGDFRQHEILTLWKKILFKDSQEQFFLGRFSAYVSSGTYIRSLVNDIGKTLGCGATILSIKRNKVGDYKIEDSIK